MKIALKTTNEQKAEEYRVQLRAHGVKFTASTLSVEELMQTHDFVLVESSNLSFSEDFFEKIENPMGMLPGTRAYNFAHLVVYPREGTPSSYFKVLKGYINPLEAIKNDDVFGWDDIFILEEGGFYLSYHAMRKRGIKQSARDYLIADFIDRHLLLPTQCHLRWSHLEGFQNGEVLDFKWDILNWVKTHPFIGKSLKGDPILSGLIQRALSNGLFFRAAKSRPQRNYWLPGLNAGIPLTEKKDAFHEATFMLHDLIHFSFPDLLPPTKGMKWTPAQIKLYCVWRMFSEALSMYYADGVFVSQIKDSGFEYDYSKRKIYPLYEVMGDELFPAIVRWMLLGDKSAFPIGKLSDTFFEKYDSFVAADWRWTIANCEHLQAHPIEIPKWHVGISVSDFDFPDDISLSELTEYLLDNMSDLLATEEDADHLDNQTVQSSAFKRWLAGQMVFFDMWAGQPGITAYKRLLNDFAGRSRGLSPFEIEHCQELFSRAVDLIPLPEESKQSWCEIYPVFPPSYVGYDTKLSVPLQDTLRGLWNRLA